ncbi:MAG TPA: zf-HC2 domain-containing protein [Planctomycetota bacterium]
MKTPAHDPWQDRLSEYLDGELAPGEHAALERHLEGCAACRATLAELRAVVAAARALGARAPERDLWPELAGQLAQRRPSPRPWLAFAAGVLATLLGLLAWRALATGAREDEVAALGERYLLLLREPEGFGAELGPAQQAALVERYARWARSLGARCLGGEELAPERLELLAEAEAPREPSGGERVGGYFVLAARDRAEALAMARTCPHLEQGGSIEVRRIQEH